MNNLFKALLIIILGAFLYLYYQNSNNDRYSHVPAEAGKHLPLSRVILDKKTGIIYYPAADGYVKSNLLELKESKISFINKDQLE